MVTSVKGVMIVALAIGLAGCAPAGTVTGPLLAPCPANAAPSDTAQLNACIRKLHFDSLPAAGDQQRLMVRDTLGAGPACHGDTSSSCRYGPLAKIEPVIKAHRRKPAQLNEGRIIARLYLDSTETESYSKLNLAPGDTTYWWIERTGNRTATSKFVRLSAGRVNLSQEENIAIEDHPSGAYGQALARFIWDDADEKTQGPCGSGCCRSGP